MTQKFVVRLLDAIGTLLAWAEVQASPKPQEGRASCPFWPTTPTHFIIEQDGIAESISVHWCDLDIARINKLVEPVACRVGQSGTFNWTEPIWLVSGMQNVALPPVTVRKPVSVGVPTGVLATVGQ